jgi:hypothetical protein
MSDDLLIETSHLQQYHKLHILIANVLTIQHLTGNGNVAQDGHAGLGIYRQGAREATDDLHFAIADTDFLVDEAGVGDGGHTGNGATAAAGNVHG